MQNTNNDSANAPKPIYPKLLFAAGIVWLATDGLIVFSVMGFLAALLLSQGAAYLHWRLGVLAPDFAYISMYLATAVLFAVGFGVVGFQNIRGTCRNPIEEGVGSIVAGALCGCLALIELQIQEHDPPWLRTDHTLRAVFYGVAAGGLLVAGILALASRRKYNAWRKAQR